MLKVLCWSIEFVVHCSCLGVLNYSGSRGRGSDTVRHVEAPSNL